MFKIVRFPSKLESFFRSLTTEFHWQHHDYFKTLVLLIAFTCSRRNISALCRHLDEEKFSHRSRFNNFLNVGRWDPQGSLRKKALQQMAALKPEKGDTVYLVIDDSKKGKRGKTMDAVGWVYDPVAQKSVPGHQYVQAVIRFKGQTIPFGVRLYVKEEDAEELKVPFRKTTALAADLIRSFDAPVGVKVVVLFDSYYLCHAVVKACINKRFFYVSTLKKNRNLFKDGRKLKAADYGKGLWRRRKRRKFSHGRSAGQSSYTYVDAGILDISDLGKHRLVYSRKNGERSTLAIVTNDFEMKAQRIIRNYTERWNIEVFFRDAKQLLGLGQYQNRSYEAAVTHLHLVCFARSLLTHIAISEGAKGKKRDVEGLSCGDLQNELRRLVWEDTAAYLQDLPDGNSVIKELDRLLVAA